MNNINYYTQEALKSRLSFGREIHLYRRHEELGVVEISYKEGSSAGAITTFGFTVVPIIVYAFDQAFNDGDVFETRYKHYFDAHTGGNISSSTAQEIQNKNQQAKLLNDEGIELLRQERYEGALEKFRAASEQCTAGEKKKYESNCDIAGNRLAEQLNRQGEELLSNGDYVGASRKFSAALEKCTSDNRVVFEDNANKAQREIAADDLNSLGNDLFDRCNFREAYSKYEEARSSTLIGQQERKFQSNKDKTQIELDAIALNSRGNELFNECRFDDARSKYQEAYDKSNVDQKLREYSSNRDKASSELKAVQLKAQGDVLFNQGRYNGARDKYQEAYNTSQMEQQRREFSTNKNKAEAELDAIDFNSQGNELFNRCRFAEALLKYQKAYDKSRVDQQLTQYSANKGKAEAELDAIKSNAQGEVLFNQGRFQDAFNKYQDAASISQVNQQKREFTSNINKAQTELKAMTLNSQGDVLFEQFKFYEAHCKYQEAYNISQIGQKLREYSTNKDKAQTELDANNLNSLGDELFLQCKFDEAILKYQEAAGKSNITQKSREYSNNRDKARSELSAINLNLQGEVLFNQGKHSEARDKYSEAYNASQVDQQRSTFMSNINKAEAELDSRISNSQRDVTILRNQLNETRNQIQENTESSQANLLDAVRTEQTELDAANLNDQGNELFNQGRYDDAFCKYHEASEKSTISEKLREYSTNKDKAKAEIDAMRSNSQGDILFARGNFSEALNKYEEACNMSQVSQQCRMFTTNKDKAQTELDAFVLNNQGNEFFEQGKFQEAHYKYQEAYNKSQICQKLREYSANKDKTRTELDALNLNAQGDALFEQCRFSEAFIKYHDAHGKSQACQKLREYSANKAKAQIELDAIDLSSLGDTLFNRGSFGEARDKYQEASDVSEVVQQCRYFTNNRDKAQTELDAIKMNAQGDEFFNQGRFGEAYRKYEEAYNKSQVVKKLREYSTNRDKAKVELDAASTNSEGDVLFNLKMFDEAHVKYEDAFNKSQGSARIQYKNNMERVQIELDAMALYNHGNILFNRNDFDQSLTKYQEALAKSQLEEQRNLFTKNMNKARAEIYKREAIDLLSKASAESDAGLKIQQYESAREKFIQAATIGLRNNAYENEASKIEMEIEAINLNLTGERLFQRRKYSAAMTNFKAAYERAHITSERNVYARNRDITMAIIHIDALWNEAWDVEIDDRSTEAAELLRNALAAAKSASEKFPDTPRLQEYEALVALKMDGNELFNQGIKLQQKGIALIQEAEDLRSKQNYQTASVKLNEAKEKLMEANSKFQLGSKSDARFVHCIQIVDLQIAEVSQALENLSSVTNSGFSDLNISFSGSSRCEDNETKDSRQYVQQI